MTRGLWIAVLALCLVPLPAARSGEVSGPLYLQDDLVIPEGEVLTLLPGTSITGPARVLVHGSLQSLGNASRRVEISVPIVLDGQASSLLQDTRIWGVAGAALTLRSGNVTLANVTFEANGVGLAVLAAGDARIDGDRVAFRSHASEGARIQGAASVTLSRAEFADNLRGLVLDLSLDAPNLARVNDSTFAREGTHVEVALGSARAPADVRFVRNDLGGTTSTGGVAHPALFVHSDLPDVAAASGGATPLRNVTSVESRYHDADTGVRLEGAGYRFTSQSDHYTANRVALSSSGASSARILGSTFESLEKDVDAPDASVVADGATFSAALRATAPTDAAPAGGAAVPSWLAGAGAAALVAAGTAGAFAWRARRRRALGHRAAGGAPAGDDGAPLAPPDLGAPLRPMERRVLEDILAHPGTAQAAVAARLGLTRQALHYHVKKLEARRLVQKSVSGRETRCTVPPHVAEALGLSPPPVTQAGAGEKT